MTHFDFSPLLRSAIGFDRITRALDTAFQANEAAAGYPPYNVQKLEQDRYRITIVVAGFREDDIDITEKDGQLTIKAHLNGQEDGAEYLHRGITLRGFERTFQLADTIKVTGASMADGLLHVDMVREVPEQLMPRRVAITRSAGSAPVVEHDKTGADQSAA